MNAEPASPLPERIPVAGRTRRRGHLGRAILGVGVLVVAAALAGGAALRSINRILDPTPQTRLERYLDNRGRERFTAKNGIEVDFPGKPTTAPETTPFVGRGSRAIAKILGASFELVWYELPPEYPLGSDPNATLPAIAGAIAAPLAPKSSGRPVDGAFVKGAADAYEFRVARRDTEDGDYHVRVLLRERRLVVLRVQATADGERALHSFADSLVVPAA